jgi:DNA-directed RNA polymerase specialized sigma24 family protein
VAEEANGSALEKTLRALLLIQMESMKQKQQIALLDRAGFGQSEIARAVGSTPGAVSVRLAELRKEGRKNRGRNKK